MDKKTLRKNLRAQRRNLSPHELDLSSADICLRLWHHPWIKTAKHIALYLPNDGEPDITGLTHLVEGMRKTFYLPALDRYGSEHMVFRQWTPGDVLEENRFGIPEPPRGKPMPVWALSVVLMPLVAFDQQGNRLGMGAGYYDRTLIIRRGDKVSTPRLIGIGHDFQEVPGIEPNPWDIPMDLVVTNKRLVCPKEAKV